MSATSRQAIVSHIPPPNGRRPGGRPVCDDTLRELPRVGANPEAVRVSTVPSRLRPGGKENRRVPGGSAKAKKAVRGRSRAWCFTEQIRQNNTKLFEACTKGLEPLGDDIRYIIFQLERGVETGNDHFQGYVEFYRPYSLAGVRSRVSESAHWEARGGSQAQAIAYCKKKGTRMGGPWEYGTKAAQGQRTDINALREACEAGTSKRKLLLDHTNEVAKYPRFIAFCDEVYFEPKWRKVEVVLCIGETRLGKTRWVYDNFDMKSFWCLPAITTGVWFDGYDGQTDVLLDDFSGQDSMVSIPLLLRILDGYTLRLPKKGGFVSWHPTRIAITTNISPNIWYSWSGKRSQYRALAARFTLVKSFTKDCVVDYVDPNEYFVLE